MKYTIYHNNRCRKSREALQFLESNNIPHSVVHYLDNPLNEEEIVTLLKALDHGAEMLIRKNESVWKTTYKNKTLNEKELIRAIAQHPKLMERPVISNGKNAVIARPIEKLHDFLK